MIIQPLQTLRSLLNTQPDLVSISSLKAVQGTLDSLLSRSGFQDAALVITKGSPLSDWKLGSLVNVQEQYNIERLRPHYKSFHMKPLFIMTNEH